MKKMSLLAFVPVLLAACSPGPDVTPPAVSLTATPESLTASGTVKLTATATDARGVTRVSFYRGDTLISTDTTAPYEASDDVKVGSSAPVSYRAVAEDAAGNKGEAKANVTLTFSAVSGQVQVGTRATGSNTLTISPWSGGAAKLNLTVFSGASGTQDVVASTALAADGSFTLPLAPLDAKYLHPFVPLPGTCTGEVKFSDPAVQGASAFLKADAYTPVAGQGTDDVAPLRLVSLSSTDEVFETGLLVYADRDVTMNGTQTCSNDTATYNVTLNKGWNLLLAKVASHFTTASYTTTTTYTNGNVPNNWLLLRFQMSGQTLGQPKLERLSSFFR